MSQCLKLRAPCHEILPATVDTMFDHPDGQVPYTRNPKPSYSVFCNMLHLHFPPPQVAMNVYDRQGRAAMTPLLKELYLSTKALNPDTLKP